MLNKFSNTRKIKNSFVHVMCSSHTNVIKITRLAKRGNMMPVFIPREIRRNFRRSEQNKCVHFNPYLFFKYPCHQTVFIEIPSLPPDLHYIVFIILTRSSKVYIHIYRVLFSPFFLRLLIVYS